HTVTDQKTGLFSTGAIDPSGGTATFTAPAKPGIYPFGCRFHPTMKGTLTVQGSTLAWRCCALINEPTPAPRPRPGRVRKPDAGVEQGAADTMNIRMRKAFTALAVLALTLAGPVGVARASANNHQGAHPMTAHQTTAAKVFRLDPSVPGNNPEGVAWNPAAGPFLPRHV